MNRCCGPCSRTKGLYALADGRRRARTTRSGEGGALRIADAGQVEVETDELQFVELDPEQLLVPAAVEGQLVVANGVSASARRSSRSLP
jgi:hypothetical protein